MYANAARSKSAHPANPKHDSATHAQKIASYYDIATAGYEDWSSNIHMHFGVYDFGMKLFDREKMLENTSKKVCDLLALDKKSNCILDMGCGVGASARYALKNGYAANTHGISLSEVQVEQANSLAKQDGLQDSAHFACMDFHKMHFADDSFDGAYAIESACHSKEADKKTLLKEAFRVLKPGSRIVLCDAFIKNSGNLNPLTQWINKKVCRNWALGCFGDLDSVKASLESIGYEDIHIKNMTFKILPSAVSIPWVSFKYFCKLIRRRESDQRYWRHLFAPLWGMALALDIMHFGYYLITAKKPKYGGK